jgi:hypothetical protein
MSASRAPRALGELPDDGPAARCQREFEFGQLQCGRDIGHPGPHLARCRGETIAFNDQGQRIEGASAEDYA